MISFGPLAAEIDPVANFNGFVVLAVLLHGTPVFAALNRGRHLYSAGWPSHWASAHILVFVLFYVVLNAVCKFSSTVTCILFHYL